ncbi:MAG: tetratricopeptide repeat protein [Bacteroidales bacterium]|nr:tetratricopeptide repeat protein [Bacteroidales bacterium]
MEQKETINIHYGVAENGKLLATQGNHKEALMHYREALRMCQNQPGADIFFQHYSLCAMESLELMGAYTEVIEFCNKCINFLDSKTGLKNNQVFLKFKASLYERKGIQYMYLQQNNNAIECFKEAQSSIEKKYLPLCVDLMNWLMRGYSISNKQINDLQKKHSYFTVRKDNINKQITVEIPKMNNPF